MAKRGWIALLSIGLPFLFGGSAAAMPASSSAEITVVFDCDAGGYVVTSSKYLSNVVVGGSQGDEVKTIYAGQQLYSVVVPTDDVTVIWVKSGSEKSGEGPGYGRRFDVTPGDCGPVDADGDGYASDVDCDDADPNVNPGATDVPNNGVDENCDGEDLVVGDGDIRATLTWDSDDDLDLNLIEPDGTEMWWMNKTTGTGGELDRDDNVGVCGSDPEPGGVENGFWPVGGAPTGSYTVRVYSFNDCQPPGSTWHLQVFVHDVLQVDATGSTGGGNGTDPRGVLLYSTTFAFAP